MVVVNRGGTFSDLEKLIENITRAVEEKFGITLEIEPEIIY